MPTPGFIPDPPKRCPAGHVVGTRKGTFRCAVAKCGHVAYKEEMLHQKKGDLDLDALAKANPDEVMRMQRMKAVGVPKGLKGEEAQAWSAQMLQTLLPEAVANLANDLRYGSDKVRSEATDKILRANGMDKRDAGMAQGGTIVLNINSGETTLPWLKRVMPKTIEAKPETPDEDE